MQENTQEKQRYEAYLPDVNGYINYSHEENQVWEILYNRQIKLIENCACKEFMEGLIKLDLKPSIIAQPKEVSEKLFKLTGWVVEPVGALINFKSFFTLLADKKFPAASFIRRKEDLDYLPEPDIFHEIFGHTPLLTDPNFANFTHEVGKLGLTLTKEDRIMLARVYWFTVEFGLMDTSKGLKIYGAGILSSKTESAYALESKIPLRKSFDLVEALRTPYRYDELQKVYFIINSFKDLYDMVKDNKLANAFAQAKQLGMIET